MEYVYLVTSLPRLELTGAPPFTSDELLAACDGLLRRDHWEDLRALLEDRPREVRAPEARRLVRAETQLREALARLRARRAGVEYGAAPGRQAEPDASATAAAARALAVADPLERELILDNYRWALLETAASQSTFGVQAVFAYALKLRLVEKWSGLSVEAGLDVATRVVEACLAGVSL